MRGLRVMGMHSKIAGRGEPMPPAELLVHFEALEDCILSGQVTSAEIQGLLSERPDFAHWFKARIPRRMRGCQPPAL